MLRGVLIAMLLLGGAAQAREMYPTMLTGKKLLELCGARGTAQRFSCGYYVMGAVDSFVNYETVATPDKTSFALCPPKDKTAEELVAVVKHYLENNPSELEQPGVVLTWKALRAAFPCR